MKRSAYDEWNELQESAKNPSNWMWVPRRNCTVEKNVKEKKKMEIDSISMELYKKESTRDGADFGDANCKRQLKFVDIGLEPDENGMRSNHGVESTKNFATASGNQVSLQSEGRKESSCNDQESSAGLGSLNALEETPLASSTPCTLMENSEEMDAKVQFNAKDMVFGKLKGYDWWPGLIITFKEAMQRPSLENCYWVRWFGDHKVSEVLNSNLVHFINFEAKYTPNRMRGIYKKGIRESLELAAKRASKIGLPVGGTKEAEDQRLEVLIDWAMNAFEPRGMSSLIPNSVEDDDSSSSDEEENIIDANAKRKLDHHKHHPIKVYRNDNKNRFGQPISNPTLAEDVKALFDDVCNGKRSIESLCLGCGDTKISIPHPLFEGGLCEECKEAFCEGSYLFDEDGSQMYCSICSDGKEVLMCDSPGCCRSYCGVCIDVLCGAGTTVKISARENWICFLCSGESIRLLKRREDWQDRIREMFLSDDEDEFPPLTIVPPVPIQSRKPVRVLSLFDGLASGLLVLKQLEIEVDVYYASEIDENANMVTKVQHNGCIKSLGDVRLITEKVIDEIGPFDVVVGGSPCNDLSIANPARKGIYEGSGRLFFEFFRIMMYCKPKRDSNRPFFWLFENVVGMRHEDKKVISRFLQCNPVMIDAKDVSAQHRARYFWGNIPGMSRQACPLPTDKLNLQECLEPNSGRFARFNKVRTITTKSNSLKQTKEAVMPVEEVKDDKTSKEDVLWCTEVERLFGFPEHYTDIGNMGRCHRQKLLGSAWSIPVLRHIMAPLKDYFRCSRGQNK